jgi:simple sugar transport system ATP-binding protein
MRVLAGILHPDSGEIEIGGRPVQLRSRKEGARQGVGIVQQHFGLVEELSGTENHLLGHPRLGAWLKAGQAREELLQTSRDLGLGVDPDCRVDSLTVGERQRLEVLIALATGADILILDEPTAALGSAEVELLGEVLRRLVSQGKSVVYITHKLPEVMEFADRVTVMRKGRVVASFEGTDIQTDTLTEAMIGTLPVQPEAERRTLGEKVAELRDVALEGHRRVGLEGINLLVRRHEIVGIAGVLGNGQESLAEVLTGLAIPSSGTAVRPSEVAYIPEDRSEDALALTLSVVDNVIVHRHRDRALRRFGQLVGNLTRQVAEKVVDEGAVEVPSLNAAAATLSGGNQQKLVVGRELGRSPGLIVAHNPYRGLDVGAALEVRRRLLEARDMGCGIVLISPDLEDLFDLADRIVVLANGRIVGEVDPQTATPQKVGALLGGVN